MKIANETKIGALTVVAVTLLILGFNFLKGKSVLKHGNFIYATFKDTKGILPSHAVLINGFQVGYVFDLEAVNKSIDSVIITIKFNEEYQIPDNSIAVIKENPLGSPSIEIKKGNSTSFVKPGGTLVSKDNGGLFASLGDKTDSLAIQLNKTLASLDQVLVDISSIMDPATKGNLRDLIANLNHTMSDLAKSSSHLEHMMDPKTGSISMTVGNLNTISKTIADKNGQISNTLNNLEKTTQQLSEADIKGILNNLNKATASLNSTLNKLNSQDGTAGAIINDKQLYNNLNSTIKSMNILLDDLRTHPKRYVNVSVFGKKESTKPLMSPLADSATTK